MKKSLLWLSALIVGFAAMFTSCSSGNDDIYQLVGADNLVTLTFSPEQVLKNAGFEFTGDGITMPQNLKNLIGENNSVNKLLELKGIDPSFVLFTMSAEGNSINSPLMIARLSNQSDLEAYLKDNDIEKETSADGYDVYKLDSRTPLLVGNSMAIVAESSIDEAVASLKACKEKANKKPLTDWQKDVLDKGETFNLVVNIGGMQKLQGNAQSQKMMADIYSKFFGINIDNAYSVFNAKLDGNKLKAKGHIMDIDGKELKPMADLPTIDTSLLKYVSAADQMIMITSAIQGIDWENYLKEIMGNADPEVVELMNSLTGTLLIAGGVDNAHNLSEIGGWHAIAVAQMAEGKADFYANKIKSLLGPDARTQGDMIVVSGRGMPSVYIQPKGNDLIIAVNTEIAEKGDSQFKSSDFKGKIFAFNGQFPANKPSATLIALPFSPKFSIAGSSDESTLDLVLEGSDKPLLQQIIDLVAEYN